MSTVEVVRIEGNAVYTVPQVGRIVGVGEGAVRKWIRAGKLPATRPGRAYLVLGSELLDFLSSAKGRMADK